LLLPTPGNVIFTVLVIGSLLWAQNAGAISLGMPVMVTTSIAGIPYQGRLADKNGAPLTQTVNMIFRLYAAANGGSPLWEEQWTGANSVQVSDGLFNVMLGSLTPIPQAVITGNSNLFLGITVGTDSEMSPRVQLGSVPFATQALTVPDGSITKAKLAGDVSLVPPDGSITSAKLAPLTITVSDESDISTSSASYVDLQKITVTLEKTSNLLLTFHSHLSNSDTSAGANIATYLDGSTGEQVARLRSHYDNTTANQVHTVSIVGIIEDVPPGTHEISIRWSTRRGGTLINYARQLSIVALGNG
jgi:hypothetical protein